MKIIANLLLLVFLCLPLVAHAELSADISNDLSVIDGYVIMPIGEEYLVDLDSRNNLHIGDILTVVKPGKKVLHPVTKEILGSIDVPVGFLKVTRIHSGYSYAAPLQEGLDLKDGAPIKRFEQVPAFFVDQSKDGGELVRQLMTNLPQFVWLGESESSRALLTFALNDDALEVKSTSGDSLHRYKRTEDQQLVNVAAGAPRPHMTQSAEPKPRLLQQVANTLMSPFEQNKDDLFAEMDEAIIRKKQVDREGIWMGPNLEGAASALAVADLDGDGQIEIATVLDNTLLVARITEGQFNEVEKVELPGSLKILSIDTLDLDGNGRSEIYLSAMSGYNPSSMMVEFDGSGYVVAVKEVRWFVRAVELPGKKERVLVGQKIGDEEKPFAGNVFHVTREGDSLVQGADITLPAKLNLYNFLPLIDDQGQLKYVYLSRGDFLRVITTASDELWESSESFGGSETCYNTRAGYKDEMLPQICLQMRMIKMPNNEILVAQNDGMRMMQNYRKYKKSRVVSLGWNGYNLGEIWRTASQSGYLADFAVADADNDGKNDLVMAIKFKHKGLMEDARSSIVIYKLD